MDEFGLEWIWMFPTLGILYEELLKHDVEAVKMTFTSFNRWLDEDWGCNYRDRIFAAPYISLCDVDWAISELEWALGRARAPSSCVPPRRPPCSVRSRPATRSSTRSGHA